MERMALVIDCQSMVCMPDMRAQLTVGKLESIDRCIDEVTDMERQSNRIDGVPDSNEVNLGLRAVAVGKLEASDRIVVGIWKKYLAEDGAVTLAIQLVRAPDRAFKLVGRFESRPIQNSAGADQPRQGTHRE